MQVVVRDVFPYRVGRCKTAVSHYSVYVFGQFQSRRHKHCCCAHRNAAEIYRKLAAAFSGCPLDPFKAIEAFDKPEAHIFAAAVVLRALFRIKYVAVILCPKIRNRSEISCPSRAPTMHGNDRPLCVSCGKPMSDKFRAVKRDYLFEFVRFFFKFFRRRFDFFHKCRVSRFSGYRVTCFFYYVGFFSVQRYLYENFCGEICSRHCCRACRKERACCQKRIFNALFHVFSPSFPVLPQGRRCLTLPRRLYIFSDFPSSCE